MKSRLLTNYFPTTVVFVDDDPSYITSLLGKIDVTQAVPIAAGSSMAAYKALKSYKPNRFMRCCLPDPIMYEGERLDLDTKVRSLHQEIYNPQRFNDISVMVVDFDMPGMNGIELRDRLADQPFKWLLLTGKADEQTVFKAFNEGKIDKYIHKDSPHFYEELNAAIRELQRSYFADLSEVVVDTIVRDPEHVFAGLEDPVFIEFVNRICQADPIVEFHITNTQGSFLLLDKEGTPSWLAVADAEQMRMYYELAEDVDSSPAILEALKTKQMIPYFQTSADLQASPIDWQRYWHPAKTLQGKETYYYAHIQEPKAYHLDRDKLVSYSTFLGTLT